LIDLRGAVIGVVVSKLNAIRVARLTDDIPQNINFAVKVSSVIDLMEAYGVVYRTDRSLREMSVSELAQQMKAYTVMIRCNW
jgi:hypothetical protein